MTAAFSCLLLTPSVARAQTIELPEVWKFHVGDDMAYAGPGFDDAHWGTASVPSFWENDIHSEYDGFAWYRTRFSVERDLRGSSLRLVLGRIDDADETYLNGVKIGGLGQFPPVTKTAYTERRAYAIPPGLLTEDNVLAVRVHDTGGPGGIVEGPIGVYNERDYAEEFTPRQGAHASFFKLPTTNGLVAAVFDARRGRIESLQPHIFKAFDEGLMVEPVIGRIEPAGLGKPVKTRYRGNTHVVTASYKNVEISWFAPFTTQEKVLVAVLEGERSAVERIRLDWKPLAGRVFTESATLPAPGGRAERYVFFGFTDAKHADPDAASRSAGRVRSSGKSLLQEELAWMRGVIGRARIPADLAPDQRAALEQSISVLKMAQVSEREIFPRARGQVLASLPPGMWTIAWTRDGVYAILGLSRLGLFDEARRALDFMLKADSGHFVHWLHKDGKDYGVGVPYRISVTRYFGIGKEESDGSVEADPNPNIELDGFGLFLIAAVDYVRRSGDEAFLRENLDVLAKEVANPLVHCMADNDLIRIDSGPWEWHLPGRQFAFTSITAAAGLRDFADLVQRLRPEDAARWRAASERLAKGLQRNLVMPGGYLKGHLESKSPEERAHFDGGTLEAFGFDVLTDPALRRSHLKVYEKEMRSFGPERGYARVSKGDWYETTEWIFLNLRIASILAKQGDLAEARKLVAWVTRQASLNYHLLPEIYDIASPAYAGAIPMVGYGAGVYAVALWDIHEAAARRPKAQ